jgi:hypothetical protein
MSVPRTQRSAQLLRSGALQSRGRYERNTLVMRGLDPRIHPPSEESYEEDGWPGQARPWRFCVWYGPGSAQRHEECREPRPGHDVVVRLSGGRTEKRRAGPEN